MSTVLARAVARSAERSCGRPIRSQLKMAGLQRVQVGTVDKFQGTEAPVVFFSLAACSINDGPLGI